MAYKQRTPKFTDGQLIKPMGYNGTDGKDYWLPVGFRVRFYLTGDTAHMIPDGCTWPDGSSDCIIAAGGVFSLEFRYADGSTSPTH